jgi:hypothetical protein
MRRRWEICPWPRVKTQEWQGPSRKELWMTKRTWTMDTVMRWTLSMMKMRRSLWKNWNLCRRSSSRSRPIYLKYRKRANRSKPSHSRANNLCKLRIFQ